MPDSSTTFEYERTNHIFRCRGIFAKNTNEVAMLITNTDTGEHTHALVNFATTILTPTRISSFSHSDNTMEHAIFSDSEKALFVGSAMEIIDGSATNTRFTQKVGYLMSFGDGEICLEPPII